MKKFITIIIGLMFVFVGYPLYRMHFDDHQNRMYKGNNADFAIVFGASIRSNGTLSPLLQKRVDDAILLYHMKRIKKIIFSGALRNQIKPGEPKVMRNYAVSKGVKTQDILLDEWGDNTYSSIQFTKKLLDTKPSAQIVYISSPFHIPRIILLSHMIGIDNFKVFYVKRDLTFKGFFDTSIRRELLAFWTYLFFYPFYKIDHYFLYKHF